MGFSSGEDKMIPSEVEFTPLSRMTMGIHRSCRVLVRVSRMWVASDPLKGMVFGLDCLLIDDEGGTMQARARGNDMKRFQRQLVEGKVYVLSDFTVSPRMHTYMACRNPLMIWMGVQTVVEEMEEDCRSPIPIHSFDFIDFEEVPCKIGDKSFYIDVIGRIKSIEDVGQAWKWEPWRNISFRNIHLQNLSGKNLKVALFGDLGRSFDAEQVCIQGQQARVIAVFAGMSVKRYPVIGLTVCSSSASKYYLNLEIPEVHQFLARLHDPDNSISKLPCQLQNPVNPTELVNRWRTIKKLRSLDPSEFENPIFLCRATLKCIDFSNGWWYRSCCCCKKSINSCAQNCPGNQSPVRWVAKYKLDAVIEDTTGTMNVIIFDEPAQELVRVPAEELAEDVTDTDDEISDLVVSGRVRALAVTFYNGCFVVNRVLNDDDMLHLNRSAKFAEADGSGHLSQEEDSSASSSCSPRVNKKEKMIKEERESKRLKTENEDELTDTE